MASSQMKLGRYGYYSEEDEAHRAAFLKDYSSRMIERRKYKIPDVKISSVFRKGSSKTVASRMRDNDVDSAGIRIVPMDSKNSDSRPSGSSERLPNGALSPDQIEYAKKIALRDLKLVQEPKWSKTLNNEINKHLENGVKIDKLLSEIDQRVSILEAQKSGGQLIVRESICQEISDKIQEIRRLKNGFNRKLDVDKESSSTVPEPKTTEASTSTFNRSTPLKSESKKKSEMEAELLKKYIPSEKRIKKLDPEQAKMMDPFSRFEAGKKLSFMRKPPTAYPGPSRNSYRRLQFVEKLVSDDMDLLMNDVTEKDVEVADLHKALSILRRRRMEP